MPVYGRRFERGPLQFITTSTYRRNPLFTCWRFCATAKWRGSKLSSGEPREWYNFPSMLFERLQIRDVVVRPAHILAPMAGITDTVFRRFIKRLGGCGLIMTEFVSSEGMIRQNFRSHRYLYYTEEERPITAQIFGADPPIWRKPRGKSRTWASTSWT